MPIEYSGQSMAASNARLRLALSNVELPPLLAALAQLTGDLSLVDPSLRGAPDPSEVLPRPHGGMTTGQREEAIARAIRAVEQLNQRGGKRVADPSDDDLRQMLHFITGPVEDDYIPLLLHELGLPYDRSAPAWIEKDYVRDEPLKVALIGAGMSGLATSHRLTQAGVDHIIFERGDDVGGVWRENSYPGCRLDTINFGYSYSFAQKNDWPHQYSTRNDVLGYFQNVSLNLGIRSRIRFNTEVTKLEYNEADSNWLVTYRNMDDVEVAETFDIVISAVGQLNTPSIPSIPGREIFSGDQFHTSQWDSSISLDDTRVALVGTGASAFQVGPAIVDQVAGLTVFQRNAPWMVPTPSYHEPTTEHMRWLLSRISTYHRWFRFHQFWSNVEGMRRFARVDESWAQDGLSVSALSLQLREVLSEQILRHYKDRPDLWQAVIPSYPPFAKRVLRDNGDWARMLKGQKSTLVTVGIDHIEAEGIVSADGVLHNVDVIIWATGFDAARFFHPIEIVGREGRRLHDVWDGEPRAYLGVSYPSFPNFFSVYGPNTNLAVNGSIVLFSESAIDHILSCLEGLLQREAKSVEVRTSVFDEYNEMIDLENTRMAWGESKVSSWYKSASGRISQNSPLPTLEYWRLTHANVDDSYSFDCV